MNFQNQTYERLIKVEEVAQICGCSVSTVWRHTNLGLLPKPIKRGGMTRWSYQEVLADIQNQLALRESA